VHTWPAAQALPQVPQFALSLCVSVQVAAVPVPQTVVLPVGHVQVPAAQVAPAAQVLPQLPQLARSVERSTHAAPHVALPEGHAQTPRVQT